MKSEPKATIALLGGAAMLVLAVGCGGSDTPFSWTKTVEELLGKIKRKSINNTRH